MKHNYLNNKDILKEIHKSKNTYCCYQSPADSDYDMILLDVKQINKKNILEARRNRADRLAKLAHEAASADGTKHKLANFEVKLREVVDTDVVFRVMSWDHIPMDTTKKKTKAAKSVMLFEEDSPHSEYDVDDEQPTKYVKVNFPPFQHFRVNDEGEPYCVGKSHWREVSIRESFLGSMVP